MNAEQFAELYGKDMDSVRIKLRRIMPGEPFDRSRELSAEVIQKLLEDGRKKNSAPATPKLASKKRADVTPPLTAAQIVEKFNIPPQVLSPWKEEGPEETTDFAAWRTAAFSWILVCIVIGHAGLIWFDCGVLWGAAGVIGGGMAFLISLAAVLLSFDSNRPRTSGFALSIAFFIDCAAWFVHFPTFKASATYVGDIQTGFISAFMCLFSFAALYMLRDSKLD